MRIHIYNPQHDYALASGSPYYTPPAEVCALRDRDALLPLKWAEAGDAILLPDSVDAASLPPAPGITLLNASMLADFLPAHPDAEIAPWGWDPMMRHWLLQNGVPPSLLPSEEWIGELRSLSHRRTSILFNELLNDELTAAALSRHASPLPKEFQDSEEAMRWLASATHAFFKAPWSSSGRGIQSTLDLDPLIHVEPWVRGIIRRQGAVIAETLFAKQIDFATEWLITDTPDGSALAEFLGVSSFEASGRGKYHANHLATQALLMERIRQTAPDFNENFIEAQRRAIVRLLESQPAHLRYNGYLGIDMMADAEGIIRGGVELNFRRTMGIPPAEVLVIGIGNVGTHLHRAFKDAGIRAAIVSSRCDTFPPAECYIIAVKDDVVGATASRLSPMPGAVVAHTSGSVPVSTLEAALPNHRGCGVFYPLQTFSKGVDMRYDEIPFLIEGDSPAAAERLLALASKVSRNVRLADSEQRAHYHLAAVLTCNFTNHLCALAESYLSPLGLDFKMLLPLMQQTITKLSSTSPAEAQTGPAARGDSSVIETHLAKLRAYPEIEAIYRLLTESIINHRNLK